MNKILALIILVYSGQLYAGCHGKCMVRNPFNHRCSYELRVCPLSTETVGRFINGVTRLDVQKQLNKLDPSRAMNFYAKKLKVDVTLSKDAIECIVDVGIGGAFGSVCAVGLVEFGPACLADAICAASCVTAKEAFKETLEDCGEW